MVQTLEENWPCPSIVGQLMVCFPLMSVTGCKAKKVNTYIKYQAGELLTFMY